MDKAINCDSVVVEAWTVTFSPDGKHVATGSHAGEVNVFSVESGERVSKMESKGKFVMSVAYVRHYAHNLCSCSFSSSF
jgi:WD40 repeat protein